MTGISIRYFIALFAVFLVISQNPVIAQTSLNKLLQLGADNNPGLQSVFKEYGAALEKIPQAGALPDPSLTFSYMISPVETRLGAQDFKIAVMQSFPWFGLLQLQQDVALLRAEAKFKAFINMRNALYLEIKSAWYQLYALDKSISLTSQNIEIVESFRTLALIKYESGLVSMADVLRADIELEGLRNDLLQLQDARQPIVTKLRSLVNDESVTIEVIETIQSIELEWSRSEAIDSMRIRNPELQKLEQTALAYQQQTGVARKAGMPSFAFGIEYTTVSARTDMEIEGNGRDILMAKIGLNLPIYRSKYKAMEKESELMAESTKLWASNLENTFQSKIEKYFSDYAEAKRRFDQYEKQIQLARQALTLLISDYSTAGKQFEEILRMESQILLFEKKLHQALAEEMTAIANIHFLTGK